MELKFKIAVLFMVLLVRVFSANFILAANPLDVVINEIAWMGTENSYNDEWIELYNNTGSSIILDGWILKAEDGTPKINLTGAIQAKSFYLLERTDDSTVPGITMDQKYTGALGNSGENLELYDNLENLLDSLSSSDGWFAGNNSDKLTMERINPLLSGNDPGNWTTSQNIGGTPKSQNTLVITQSQKELAPQPDPEILPEQTAPPSLEIVESTKEKPIIYPSGILINEIMPAPVGKDSEEEWIEFFNQNDFEVDLTGWQITDTIGSINAYTFPKDTKIGPKGFLMLSRPTTKITLNNDGDSLQLLQPNGSALDKMSYGKALRGESYNRTKTEWSWSSALTPGSVNIIPKAEDMQPKKKEPLVLSSEANLAAVGESFKSIQNTKTQRPLVSLCLFLIAFGLAIFSGIIILTLKKNLNLS